ncbi:MAG TPA: YdjY domain-containing protein [Verrucomicrobiae bacterium]
MRTILSIIALCLLGISASAQTGSRPLSLDLSKTNSVAPTNTPAKPTLKEISDGVFELGIVRLNKQAKTVSFPAVVNMRGEDIVEYWLVNTGGKIHESVLKTDAEPYHIHLAMLLIGAKGRPNLTPVQRVEDKTTAGDTIALWFEYKDEKGEKVKKRAEETVHDKSTKATMTKGDWTYNGSWIFNGAFVAQRELSIVSNIHDHDALINNPRPKREDDDNWLAETKNLPTNGTPVTVTIELIKPYAKPDKYETKP